MPKAQLFITCLADQFYTSTLQNMTQILERLGVELAFPPEQTCCGQPAFNAGFWEDAKDVCGKFIKDFSGSDYIIAPSASCTGFVRNYYNKLFEDSSQSKEVRELGGRLYEFSEFLIKILNIDDFGATLQGKATYHDSCAALRECKIKEEPRKLLSKVAGLELTEMNDVETCCGFGGTFAVKFEPISIAMADQKITNASDTNAEYIISTDMSCLMHLDGYIKNKKSNLKTLHLADVLASGW